MCGPLGSSAPAVKSMPVPASGWLTSGATGWSVGVSPLKNRPVELTPVLGMEAAKLTAALWSIPLEPRPKPLSPCAAGPGGVVVVKASNVPLPVAEDQVAVGRDRGGRSCLPDPPEVAIRCRC